MTIEDAYRLLNSTKDSSFSYIKSQYHALAKQYHPDVNASTVATEKMKQLNEAWQMILDNYSIPEEEIKNSEPADRDDKQENEGPSYTYYGKQEGLWYTVKMNLSSGLRIPMFCPITMSGNCSSFKNIKLGSVYFEPSGGKRVTMHSSRIEVPFSIKDDSYSHILKKYVKIYYFDGYAEFRFRNREYAELFAAVNSCTVKEETKKDVAIDTAKKAASAVGRGTLTLFAMAPWLLILLIVLIVSQCSK